MSIVSLKILSSDLQRKLCSQDTTVLVVFYFKKKIVKSTKNWMFM